MKRTIHNLTVMLISGPDWRLPGFCSGDQIRLSAQCFAASGRPVFWRGRGRGDEFQGRRFRIYAPRGIRASRSARRVRLRMGVRGCFSSTAPASTSGRWAKIPMVLWLRPRFGWTPRTICGWWTSSRIW